MKNNFQRTIAYPQYQTYSCDISMHINRDKRFIQCVLLTFNVHSSLSSNYNMIDNACHIIIRNTVVMVAGICSNSNATSKVGGDDTFVEQKNKGYQ